MHYFHNKRTGNGHALRYCSTEWVDFVNIWLSFCRIQQEKVFCRLCFGGAVKTKGLKGPANTLYCRLLIDNDQQSEVKIFVKSFSNFLPSFLWKPLPFCRTKYILSETNNNCIVDIQLGKLVQAKRPNQSNGGSSVWLSVGEISFVVIPRQKRFPRMTDLPKEISPKRGEH